MSGEKTIVLYALSTLTQTCAALAAFVGAVGIFRLQMLRDERRGAEQEFRVVAGRIASVQQDFMPIPIQEIVAGVDRARQRARKPSNLHNEGHQANVHAAEEALANWRAFDRHSAHSRRTLIIFEVWNLLVIGVALIGFNYVPTLAASSGTFWAIWAAAARTVAVTGHCVFAWTSESPTALALGEGPR